MNDARGLPLADDRIGHAPDRPPGPRRRRIRVLVAVVGYVAILILATRTIDRERFTEVLASLTFERIAAGVGLIRVHHGTRGVR
jgi:hypothetical protein